MSPNKADFLGENITCIRGGRIVFQNLSFSVMQGEILHLAGPNGAGKSSLMRIMCGILPAAEGRILWQGRPYLEEGRAGHSVRFSFLPPDDRSLKMQETANENLLFWAKFHGTKDIDKKCEEALAAIDMNDLRDTPVRYLSAGQKRRLSLARVFVKDAPLWLLDEPLNALDAHAAALFAAAVDRHCKKGGSAVIASHADFAAKTKVRQMEMGK